MRYRRLRLSFGCNMYLMFNQKMLHVYSATIRSLRQYRIGRNFLLYSTTPSVELPTLINKIDNVNTESSNETVEIQRKPISVGATEDVKSRNLVAAVFASLKSDSNLNHTIRNVNKTKPVKKNATDEIIANATTVDGILLIAESPTVSRRHALKVVSILADWSAAGRVKLSDFETDIRFQKLCRILGRNSSTNYRNVSRGSSVGDDLSTVLGVTGDDEAAKLVASISLTQMVKVLSALAQKRRRSTPLLRSLAHNITKSNDKLDLKQCADVLYAAAALTFPEIPLLDRACSDLVDGLAHNSEKSAVIGSVLTSLGLLRYKNTDVLNAISDWVVKHHEVCRPHDLFALFLTFAVVSHHPANADDLYKILVPQLNVADTSKPSSWVDVVWSLVILNQATEEHVSSVLKPEFVARLQNENCLTVATKIKLLNIQASVSIKENYNGPLIPEGSDVHTVTINRSREKQTLVAAMLDSLGSLLPSVTYLKSNVDTGMGFLLDAECLVDSKCNPLPVVDGEQPSNGLKIAFMAYDYHDLCRGKRPEPNGMNMLAKQLLERKGYQVLPVPYTEFNPRDKLVRRVQYLETQLKNIVKQSSVKL